MVLTVCGALRTRLLHVTCSSCSACKLYQTGKPLNQRQGLMHLAVAASSHTSSTSSVVCSCCCFEGSPVLHCNRRPQPLASHSAWRTLRVPTFRAASSPPSRGRVSQEAPSRLGGKHRLAPMHMSRCCQRTVARPALGRPWWVAGMGEFATVWHVQRPSKPRRATAASNCNVVRVTGAMAFQDRRADQPARQCGAKLH